MKVVIPGGSGQVGTPLARAPQPARPRSTRIDSTPRTTWRRASRCGLGGTAGDGRQFVFWIHDANFRATESLITREDVDGVVNVSAPSPVPNAGFMREPRRTWRTGIGLSATRWMLEVGAVVTPTETELVLKSRRGVPRRLLDQGFVFAFPDWSEASADLCERYRART